MSVEKALQVLRAQAGVDLGECAKRFMEASNAHVESEAEAARRAAAVAATQNEIARLESAGSLNLASYDFVRRLHHAARAKSDAARNRSVMTAEALDVERTELARLRQLETGLGRTLAGREAEARRARSARDEAIVDDLWLQIDRRTDPCC